MPALTGREYMAKAERGMNPRSDQRWRAFGVPCSASRDPSKRLATIPFHGVAHRRLECVEFGGGTPADVVMLVSRKGDPSVLWSSPVNFFVDVGHCGRDCGKRAGVRQTLHC